MKINLKIDKKMEKSIHIISETTGIELSELITDVFIMGLQILIFSLKIIRSKSKRGGELLDKDISNIA